FIFFLSNATLTTPISTLSLHDALPISSWAVGDLIPLLADGDEEVRYQAAAALRRLTGHSHGREPEAWRKPWADCTPTFASWQSRSEEHTSELQSLRHLVCRLLLEKKKK